MEGWIKLHRKLIKWEWYKKPHMVHLFIHLVMSANHKPKRWQGIEIQRGQLVTGRKSLSAETGISQQTIRTALERLKSTNELTIKSTSQYSIITICNYDSYQIKEEASNQQINQQPNHQSTSDQPTTNQRSTTNKKEKKLKNDNNDKKKERFTPPPILEIQMYFQSKGSNNLEAEKFFNFYESKNWMVGKTKMKKWKNAAANWIIKNNENGQANKIPKRTYTAKDFEPQ